MRFLHEGYVPTDCRIAVPGDRYSGGHGHMELLHLEYGCPTRFPVGRAAIRASVFLWWTSPDWLNVAMRSRAPHMPWASVGGTLPHELWRRATACSRPAKNRKLAKGFYRVLKAYVMSTDGPGPLRAE